MKYALSFLTLTMALSSGAAFAAGVGEVAQAQADITFAAPSTISHEVMPVTGLNAGSVSAGTLLANGTVTTEEEVDNIQARFLNGTGTRMTAMGPITTIKGAVDGNTLEVILEPSAGTTINNVLDDSVILGHGLPSKSFSYAIKVSTPQTVAPDTYTIQLSAQRWQD